jgi:hypothetical protein
MPDCNHRSQNCQGPSSNTASCLSMSSSHRGHDVTVDWCWPNLANTWICLVLDWANTWNLGLLSIPLRRAPQAVQLFGHYESVRHTTQSLASAMFPRAIS